MKKYFLTKKRFFRGLEEPGVFETMRSYNGKVFKFDEHLERLFNSANSVGILLNKKSLKRTLKKYLKRGFSRISTRMVADIPRINPRKSACNLRTSALKKDGYIRVAVDRGGNIDIIFRPQKTYPKELYERGIEVFSVPVRRNLVESQNPKIKSRDFLWGVMARIDSSNYRENSEKVFFNADSRKSNADSRRFSKETICVNPRAICENLRSRKIFQRPFEAILLNRYGYVTEGTVSNIFIIKDKLLFTTPLYCGILEGITRKYVIELAEKLGIGFKESVLTRHDIYNADEAFLTNTSMEIMPVVKFDERLISSGRPGQITKELIKEFRKKNY